jgi:hypothetical protein
MIYRYIRIVLFLTIPFKYIANPPSDWFILYTKFDWTKLCHHWCIRSCSYIYISYLFANRCVCVYRCTSSTPRESHVQFGTIRLIFLLIGQKYVPEAQSDWIIGMKYSFNDQSNACFRCASQARIALSVSSSRLSTWLSKLYSWPILWKARPR